jgi:hypothetical protein
MANEEDPMLEPLDGQQMHDPKRQATGEGQ